MKKRRRAKEETFHDKGDKRKIQIEKGFNIIWRKVVLKMYG